MSLSVVQTVKASNSNGTTATTGNITTTSGGLVVVVAGGWRSGAHETHVITDNKSNTWTEVSNGGLDPSTNTRFQMFYAKNITGGSSHTFTTTTTNACTGLTLIALEIAGADTVSPFDTSAVMNGNSTSPASTATATRAQADEIIVGAVGTGDNVNNGTLTAGTNFTLQDSQLAFANYVCGIETWIVSATGTDQATFTISSDSWVCFAATFKAAAVGSLPPQSQLVRQAVNRSYTY